MPRVTHVKSARKNNPVAKKGESYYWWKFRYGGKRYSLTRPRASQLTQSAYYGSIRALCEQIEDASVTDYDSFESLRDEVRDEIQNIGSECQDSLDNMPDSLQYSPTGELLQERIDACENADGELDYTVEFEFDEDEFDEDIELDEGEELDDLRKEHEEAEELRRESDLEDWANEAKDALLTAVQDCEV